MRSLFVVAVSLLLPPTAGAQSAAPGAAWRDFRGPTLVGEAPEGASLPLTWSEHDNVAWKADLPGKGWSSPIIDAGRIWMTTALDGGRDLRVLCADLETGALLLEKTLFEVAEPGMLNRLNSHASPSPVAAGGRVFVHFGTDGTAALDAATGDVLWRRDDIRCDHMVGAGSSPLVYGDLLILNMDGGDVQYVIALDQTSGETVWRRDRSTDFAALGADYRKAFSTPITLAIGGRDHLVSSGAQATFGYDPLSGEELWQLPHGGFSQSSRPIAGAPGVVFLNTGFMRAELVAARITADGDATSGWRAEELWRQRRGIPTMPSPVFADGRVYLVSDSGILSCLDAASGERLWHERIGGEHSASLLLAEGRIYVFDREGRTVVIAPGDEYRELAANQLDDGCMASAAVAGDALVLRTRSALYRIEDTGARDAGAERPRPAR